MAGYEIYLDGSHVGTETETIYHDSSLTENTQYCYTVSAYDNAGNTSPQSEQVCTSTLASSNLDIEDSPFGFHSALVLQKGYDNNGYDHAQDIGVRWERPSQYVFWFIVQPDLSDPTYNWEKYDWIFRHIPEDIRILANIAPQGYFDEGYTLSGSYLPIDTNQYMSFVQATVERYDGDGDQILAGRE